MSAGQSASTLLISLVSTAVLFTAFALAIRIPALANYSYQVDYGWQRSAQPRPAGECDRPLTGKGFPLATERPAKGDPSGCLTETNPLAGDMDLALCFAVAAIIAAGEASVISNMRS